MPRRNHLSPSLLLRLKSPKIGRITRNYTKNPFRVVLFVLPSGRLLTRFGISGCLPASVVHLLCMDTTTQTSATFLIQRDVSALMRIPECTLEDWRFSQVGPPYLKLGHHVRYDVHDVLTWAHENRHG